MTEDYAPRHRGPEVLDTAALDRQISDADRQRETLLSGMAEHAAFIRGFTLGWFGGAALCIVAFVVAYWLGSW